MNHIFDLKKVENYREAKCPICGTICTIRNVKYKNSRGVKVSYKNSSGIEVNKKPPCVPVKIKPVKIEQNQLDEKSILLRLVHDEILPLFKFKKNSVQGNIADKLRREIGEYK